MVKALSEEAVVAGVAEQIQWWIQQRVRKLKKLSHDTMSVNPFLVPLILQMHSLKSFNQLAEFLLVAHMVNGYATGFGKLVDERILPNVFGTTKLNKKYRKENRTYMASAFDDIDHVVEWTPSERYYLSLKAGRWTIQLGQAVGLNKAFQKLVHLRDDESKVQFKQIVVGVIYGKETKLTDKYAILRGICTGAKHDVVDLQKHVMVRAGKEFWAWINRGERMTQTWLLEGIQRGLEGSANELASLEQLLKRFQENFVQNFQRHLKQDKIDWHGILEEING